MDRWTETALILIVNLVISFAAGCATRRASYARALRTPAAMVICLAVQFVVRPGVVYGLVRAFGVPGDAALGCMLCAMAPGGNGSNLLEIIFGGNVELGIACTLCSSLLASVAIPLNFFLYAKEFSSSKFRMPWADIASAIGCVVAGASAGAFVRYCDDGLGKRLEHRTAAVGLALLVTAVIIAVVSNQQALYAVPLSAWIATIFPCPCSLACAYFPSRLSGLSLTDARTVAIEVGECNIGVAYAILLLLYDKPEDDETRIRVFSGIVAYTIFNEFYIFGLAILWRLSHTPTSPPPLTTTAGAGDDDGGQPSSSSSSREEGDEATTSVEQIEMKIKP